MRILPLLLFLALFQVASAREPREDKRINHLIGSIEALQGKATMIRNGSEHDAKQAAAHIRAKLEKAGERVKTAESFINDLASKSLTSGKPYQIKYKDGKVQSAGDFLREKLKEFDAAPK